VYKNRKVNGSAQVKWVTFVNVEDTTQLKTFTARHAIKITPDHLNTFHEHEQGRVTRSKQLQSQNKVKIAAEWLPALTTPHQRASA